MITMFSTNLLAKPKNRKIEKQQEYSRFNQSENISNNFHLPYEVNIEFELMLSQIFYHTSIFFYCRKCEEFKRTLFYSIHCDWRVLVYDKDREW